MSIQEDNWVTRGVCEGVKKRRAALRMSQQELSEKSGLHRTYISDLERGARNISLTNLQRLSEALQLRPADLLLFAEHHSGNTQPEKPSPAYI